MQKILYVEDDLSLMMDCNILWKQVDIWWTMPKL